MAELAGLTLGVASLGGLFTNCVELAEFISLARNMGSDYEASYTKFLLLRSRLVACGDQLSNILDDRSGGNGGRSDDCERRRHEVARSLFTIKRLLENVMGLEEKYGLRKAGEGDDARLAQRDGRDGQFSALAEVERSLQCSVTQRQQKATFGKKFTWAIRDRKAFDRLINDLAFHVNELESLSLRTTGARNLAEVMPAIPLNLSLDAVKLLNKAAEEPDLKDTTNQGNDCATASVASPGHVYLRNQIKERARVLQGDVGECGPHSRRHVFEENIICGGSKVVQGNVAYDFMEDFWKE